MIQRIQSLYVLLAMTALSVMFFFPLAVVNPLGDVPSALNLTGVSGFMEGYTAAGYWFVGFTVLAVLLLACMAFILFSYKNRMRQIRLSRIVSFVLVLFVGVLLLGLDQAAGGMFPGREEASLVQYRWPVYMPLVALVFMWLALRGIRKDEELVRSSDRLR
ncbi:MAG: DUF4293 domain-containing protein [Bacteroidales bacterium]|nr:DUF4293 domain-containing protein [Bacteroidales bacterium]